MEHYRKFERSCLRACLGRYRTADSNYTLRIDNKTIYDAASIPRFDSFCLMLTRNYFSSLYQIDNEMLKKLKVEEEKTALRMARSNYSPPELFTNLDKRGCIQNSVNIPIIYHSQRHCARKAIYTDPENMPRDKWVYSTALPESDINCLDRLNDKYWWLQGDAKFMDELRRRARLKKQQQQQQ
ncbi:GSCOCG00012032001-RA-CDS [Cotesia congregata]|nr:GSCOCG00012032001-RA-CDS [Cotesia congregata]